MQELEQRLQQRFPDWFHGRRGQLARPLLRSVGRWSRLDQIEAFLQRSSGCAASASSPPAWNSSAASTRWIRPRWRGSRPPAAC
jgi:hypothetical protein